MELIMAQINGEDKFKIFPFEYEITRRFYLFANNNSLDNLNKRINIDGVDEKISKENISLYGNGINWSKAWNCFDELAKETIISFLIDGKEI